MSDDPRWGPAHTYRARPSWRRGRHDGARRGEEHPGRHEAPRPPQAHRDAHEDSQPPPPPRRRPGGRIRTLVLVVVLVVVAYPLALAVTGYLAMDRVGRLQASGVGDTPGHTVLLVGSDSREGTDIGGGGGARTDTIMLLHRPTGGGPTVLLSIPRDSAVEIPGHGENKINAAYSLGGAQLLAQTVEAATGIGIDSYVETDLAGFPDIVDAVGGVELCPAEPIQDPKAGDLDIAAGCQEMDGGTALGYARTRAGPEGDLGRVERQRELIAAIAEEGMSPATLLNPLSAFALASSAGNALTVDDGTGPVDLARFALAMRAVAGGDALTLTVPVAGTDRRTDAGVVVDWDAERAQQLFEAIRTGQTESIRPLVEASR